MKTTVDSDLMIEASDEAKVCLTCKKKKCTPTICAIFGYPNRRRKKKGSKTDEKS
jgi:hypothetical protein